ncbi:hypothetical protein [Methanoregula sp.]|uniref:hypothetical protein n=1 Tax=Methanoregula sp. TaxID=2052170 RepID=UPI003568BD78
MVKRNTILFVEKVNLINLLYIFFFGRSFQKILFVSQNRLIEKIQPGINRILNIQKLQMNKVRYGDIPGSDFDVREETYLRSDDFFDRYQNNIFTTMCVDFCKNPLFEVAVRKEFLLRYTTLRMKTHVFLFYLSEQCDEITFIPVDNENFFSILSQKYRPNKPYFIPVFFQVKNSICKTVSDILSFIAIPLVVSVLGLYVLKRGITVSKPEKKISDFGLDVQSSGLMNDRGLHSDGTFFLYDAHEFHPSKILHVIDGRITDNNARASLEKFGSPYIELGTLKVPLSYAGRRIGIDFIVKNSFFALRWIFSRNKRSSFLVPSFIVMKMTMDAEINSEYLDIHVFISRDDYSTVHIVRTLVARKNGNRTVGFQFADYSDHDLLSHIVYDKYALWGEFHREFHEKALQYSETEIIGANLYGSDELFRLIKTGYIPHKYEDLKKNHRIVAILSSGYHPELFLTKEITMEFYKTILEKTSSYPDVIRVIKTKRSEYVTQELRDLIKGYQNVLIEEELSTYNFLPVADLVVCIWSSSIGLESIMAGKKVVYYDRTDNWRHPYAHYNPYLVAFTPEDIDKNLERILQDHEYLNPAIIEKIQEYHGYRFDGKVTERFKAMCLRVLEIRDMNNN